MNFKKIFTFLMIAAASMVMATEAQKMAVVDMEIIILSHPKAEENDKALRAKQAELEVQRDALLAELKAKEERIMQQNRYIGDYPVIGIRPVVDGRRGPMKLRESLAERDSGVDELKTEDNDFHVQMPWGYCGNEIFNGVRKAEVEAVQAEKLNAFSDSPCMR